MKKSRFSEKQMVAVIRKADKTSVGEVARKHKVSEWIIYGWRRRLGGLTPADVRCRLEAESGKLKRHLAEPTP